MGYLRKVVNEWRAIGRRGTLLDARALRRAYLGVQAVYIVGVRLLRLRPRRARVLGIRFRVADYRDFAMMFEEIFVREEYRFEPVPEPVIVDCGANIGVATAWFKSVAPAARVTCYEPDAEAAALLRENIARNGWEDVAVVEAAVSDRDGEARLAGPPASPLSRLGPDGRAVRTVRLSSALPDRVDLCKLDIEGSEAVVIADLAAAGALARVRRVALEVNHAPGASLAAVLGPLEAAGFACAIWAPAEPPLRPGSPQNVLVVAARP